MTTTQTTTSTNAPGFERVLIANRGEIARRIISTAREMGLGTVAVFTAADAAAPHATEADHAVELNGDTLADTYLSAEALLDAARVSGADAIHPGYGFLSENADFARAVIAAGLTWIGPDPDAIIAMGSKISAKELMGDAGVPLLTDLDPATVTDAEFPVLIKASAGGGGRGMRVARSRSDLDAQVAEAQREAKSAFGDDAVFCERYLETGHHVEVQIMADRHGTVWAVGERECSIQRRHQKIIEESPSPLIERLPHVRAELFDAARAAASAIGYVGAGTVEFLATDDGEFFFLEVNTRLQVEHPVTEATSGLDLVRLQFEIAAGTALPADEPPRSSGHAIEARLYAEVPASEYRPAAGTLHTLELPGRAHCFRSPFGERAYVRIDSAAGDVPLEVGTEYDPMIAKIITFAPNRADAVRALAAQIRGARIHGIDTNRDQLVRILEHPGFTAGTASTAFLGEVGGDVLAPVVSGTELGRCAIAAALAIEAGEADATSDVIGIHPVLRGFRNVGAAERVTELVPATGEEAPAVRAVLTSRRAGAEAAFARTVAAGSAHDAGGAARPWSIALASGQATAGEDELVEGTLAAVLRTGEAPGGPGSTRAEILVRCGGLDGRYVVTVRGEQVDVDGPVGATRFSLTPRHPDPNAAVSAGSLLAPMPGSIIRVDVAEGDTVSAGQSLLRLEAMKMEHTVTAPEDGVVTELPVAVGDKVDAGQTLVVIDQEGDGEGEPVGEHTGETDH